MIKPYQKAHLRNKRYFIGNFQYLNINTEFYQNALYQVSLYNPWVESESELKQQVQEAYDLVETQYGKPDSLHSGSVGRGADIDLFIWHIGRKRIKIISGYAFNMYTVTLQFEDIAIIRTLQGAAKKRQDSLTQIGKKEI